MKMKSNFGIGRVLGPMKKLTDKEISAGYLGQAKKLSKKELFKELEHLYGYLMESSEWSSGAILRWDESITETKRLKTINKAANKQIKRIFNTYGIL